MFVVVGPPYLTGPARRGGRVVLPVLVTIGRHEGTSLDCRCGVGRDGASTTLVGIQVLSDLPDRRGEATAVV